MEGSTLRGRDAAEALFDPSGPSSCPIHVAVVVEVVYGGSLKPCCRGMPGLKEGTMILSTAPGGNG